VDCEKWYGLLYWGGVAKDAELLERKTRSRSKKNLYCFIISPHSDIAYLRKII
jgi:hypothetical protein